MEILQIAISVAAAAFVGNRLYHWMFEDSTDFWDCVTFSLTPDIFSMFRGQYFEDISKSAKLSIFLAAIGLSGYLTYQGLSAIMDSL